MVLGEVLFGACGMNEDLLGTVWDILGENNRKRWLVMGTFHNQEKKLPQSEPESQSLGCRRNSQMQKKAKELPKSRTQ